MPLLRNLSEEASAFDIFAAFPAIYAPFAEFCQELFRGPGPLEPRDWELLFAFASRLNECKYCFGGHSNSAYKLGIPEGTFEALLDDIDTADVPDRMKPLLRYVRKLNDTPTRMTEADAEAIYTAGWDAEAFHLTIALCCMANYMNRLVDGSGIAADPALFSKRADLAIQHGYAEPFRMRLAARQSPGD